MKINRYIDYVNSFIINTSTNPFYKTSHSDQYILPSSPKPNIFIKIENDRPKFYAPEAYKFIFEPIYSPIDLRWKYALHWMNSRNLFIDHIIKTLFNFQQKFWKTNELKTLKPITLKKFIEQFPFPYLEISRLSRLLRNNSILFDNKKYLLRELFLRESQKNRLLLEELASQQLKPLPDRELQKILKAKYRVDISIRNICRYRKSCNISASNKTRSKNPYENCFSNSVQLDKKFLKTIPNQSGVYELSTKKNIKYVPLSSNVIYFGRSENLRKRIGSYLYANLGNGTIRNYRDDSELFFRYFSTAKYKFIEHELLRNFRDKFGTLPIGNKQLPKSP